MYDQFYGFRRRPFSLNPDPSYLYQSTKHQTALCMMEYALINEAAFCVITGEPGIGKTTLVRKLFYQIRDEYQVGLLNSTHQSFRELLKLILIAFDIDCQEKGQVNLYKVFYTFLIKQYAHHNRTVLIIDEAQNLSPKTLEELRMLSNVNVDKHNVLQIILVGQESLRDTLKQRGLTQFAQRIAVDYHLETLDRLETHAYIIHRLKIAGGQKCQQIFGLETCDAVYRYTSGVPRLINLLCDLALVYGYAEQQQILEPELINDVVNEKKKSGVLPLREQAEPLTAENLDALSQLHTSRDDDHVDFDESPSYNEEEVVTKVSTSQVDRIAPALDYLVIGRIFDDAPIPANQDQDVQVRTFAHRSKCWFKASGQLYFWLSYMVFRSLHMFGKSEKEPAQKSANDVHVPAPVPPQAGPTEPKVVARAVIGASLHFRGDLSGDEDLEVHGRFEGTIELNQNNLTVGKQGSVQANVRAKIINVEGKIEGDLTGEERVVVRDSGNVRGNIIAPRVSLEDGAKFKGSIDMEPKAEKSSKSNRSNSVVTTNTNDKDNPQKQLTVQRN